jgi:hypothetical protein
MYRVCGRDPMSYVWALFRFSWQCLVFSLGIPVKLTILSLGITHILENVILFKLYKNGQNPHLNRTGITKWKTGSTHIVDVILITRVLWVAATMSSCSGRCCRSQTHGFLSFSWYWKYVFLCCPVSSLFYSLSNATWIVIKAVEHKWNFGISLGKMQKFPISKSYNARKAMWTYHSTQEWKIPSLRHMQVKHVIKLEFSFHRT